MFVHVFIYFKRFLSEVLKLIDIISQLFLIHKWIQKLKDIMICLINWI